MKKLLLIACVLSVGSLGMAQDNKPVKPDESKVPAKIEKVDDKPAVKPDETLLKGRQMGQAVPLVFEKDHEVYGAKLQLKDSTKLADVMKDPKAFDGKQVRVTGTIDSVCQKKGCWMILKDGTAETRVKFTGYKFFVPLDVAGRMVTVEGKPEVKVVTEAMRRHYAQDAGKSKEEIAKIVGDETTIGMMVDAVEICGKPGAKASCCEGEADKAGAPKKEDGAKPAKESGKSEASGDACGGCKEGEKKSKDGGCCDKTPEKKQG